MKTSERVKKEILRTASEEYAAFEIMGLSVWEQARVLDVGCADGFNTFTKFSPYQGVEEVVGIDPCAEAVFEAQKNYGDDRFNFFVGRFEAYEAKGHFDLIYFSFSLEYEASKETLIDKAYQCLKPGGYLLVKMLDGAGIVSYPDPKAHGYTLQELCGAVVPSSSLLGSAFPLEYQSGCRYPLVFLQKGFLNRHFKTFSLTTVGRNAEERQDLCAWFRWCVEDGQQKIDTLKKAETEKHFSGLEKLFKDDSYFFSATAHLVLGQRPQEGDCCDASKVLSPKSCEVHKSKGMDPSSCVKEGKRFFLRPMTEEDIGFIMPMEVSSFSSPWTPLAYALELRHNPVADYRVLVTEEGEVMGYGGVWYTPECARLLRIAVAQPYQRQGWGACIVDALCQCAQKVFLDAMVLEVRASNKTALMFYRKLGFECSGTVQDFYTEPSEPALVMTKYLRDER